MNRKSIKINANTRKSIKIDADNPGFPVELEKSYSVTEFVGDALALIAMIACCIFMIYGLAEMAYWATSPGFYE